MFCKLVRELTDQPIPNQKSGPTSLILGNLKKLRKVLLNRVECIEIYWMTNNLDPSNF